MSGNGPTSTEDDLLRVAAGAEAGRRVGWAKFYAEREENERLRALLATAGINDPVPPPPAASDDGSDAKKSLAQHIVDTMDEARRRNPDAGTMDTWTYAVASTFELVIIDQIDNLPGAEFHREHMRLWLDLNERRAGTARRINGTGV